MKVVAALGGNALLRRGEPMTADNQRENIKRAAIAIGDLVSAGHNVVVTHGNGPQVGLLALQSAAYDPNSAYPLDVLGAETEGMIGYLIEQELENVFYGKRKVATLLTQVLVDRNDQAFSNPSKPVGPVYSKNEAERLAAARGWIVKPDGDKYRRVVASPVPQSIPDVDIISLLLAHDVIVICAGGGGIPVIKKPDGSLIGIEAVIDKDASSALLAECLGADALLLLTDVDAVYLDWDKPGALALRNTTPDEIELHQFAAGSMGPKVMAASRFVRRTHGIAGIGQLKDAVAILQGKAGTFISRH